MDPATLHQHMFAALTLTYAGSAALGQLTRRYIFLCDQKGRLIGCLGAELAFSGHEEQQTKL